jgi:TAT (twin-arginine translocation) pathway signal sequence
MSIHGHPSRRDFLSTTAASAAALALGPTLDAIASREELWELSAVDAVAAMTRGEITAEQFASALLARCKAAASLNVAAAIRHRIQVERCECDSVPGHSGAGGADLAGPDDHRRWRGGPLRSVLRPQRGAGEHRRPAWTGPASRADARRHTGRHRVRWTGAIRSRTTRARTFTAACTRPDRRASANIPRLRRHICGPRRG